MAHLITILLVLFAQVAWRPSYSQAVADSKSSGKPIYVFVTEPGCVYCVQQEAAFKDLRVIEVLKDFVPVKVRGDLDKRWHVASFPMSIIGDWQWVIARRAGAMSASDTVRFLMR